MSKKKCRIIKRELPDERTEFVIQQKHFLFRWQWVDAWVNSIAGAACRDSFESFEEAKRHLCYFDGSESKETMVY